MFGDGSVFPQRPGKVARARSAGPCVGRRSVSRCLCFLEVLGVLVVRFSLKIVGQKLTTCLELTPTSNCTPDSMAAVNGPGRAQQARGYRDKEWRALEGNRLLRT